MLRRFESCTRHVSDSPDPERVRAAASRDSDATVQSTLLGRVLGSPAVPLRVLGRGSLPSVYPVTELAVASVAAAALATRKLLAALGHDRPDAVLVDRRLASLWFGSSLRPQGWQPPPAWDPLAGDYRAADGWVRLHTNAPAHRQAALRVLGVSAAREEVAAAVARHPAEELEAAVHAAGGCAAALRTPQEWSRHEQGRAVAAEPLVAWSDGAPGGALTLSGPPGRPLAGLRVLDLTRVLAGPVATRYLALLGAEVLRVDPPDWDEPAITPDVMAGKRSTRLDLRSAEGRASFERLLAGADLLVHGLRPGALDGLGYGTAARAGLRPGLLEVSLSAYGHTGPWAGRRGFDSLVQMSTGIAAEGMRLLGRDRPTPLPVQALDHATGWLLAAAAVDAVAERLRTGRTRHARLSLARTALALGPADPRPTDDLAPEDEADLAPGLEHTGWGPARRLRPPLTVPGVVVDAALPARPLGQDLPEWRA